MKVKILLEDHVHTDGQMPRGQIGSTFTSNSSLERRYDLIGELKTIEGLVRFYKLKDINSVIGVVDSKKPDTGEDSNAVIFSLKFKKAHTIVNMPKLFKDKTVLQVDKVITDPTCEGYGISSLAYLAIARMGYVVLFDTVQFTDGKMLWKKISRESKFKNYKVNILDDEYGFKTDISGKPIDYDSSNIDDAAIWTSGQDYSGEHILLAMTT